MAKVVKHYDMKIAKTNLSRILDEEEKILFENIINHVVKRDNLNGSQKGKRICVLAKIFSVNPKGSDYKSLLDSYLISNDFKYKLLITGGNEAVESYNKKLKNRPKPEVVSHFKIDYWLNKGYNEEEAIEQVANVQKTNALKRKSESYENTGKHMKTCIDFWTNQGYSKEEAEILRRPHLDKISVSLDGFILRHGEEKGFELYFKRIQKYKDTCKQNLPLRRTAGYVSKESMKFFIPFYKECRKRGLKREEIYFGIKGSKEYFLKDKKANYNTGGFYDFAIPKLKVIVEYHGLFWHARNIDEWRNSFIDYNDAIAKDRYKENLAKEYGFKYIIVWSDIDKRTKINELIQEIFNE